MIEQLEEIDISERLKMTAGDQEKADLLNRYSWKIRHTFPNKALDCALKARELSANIDYKLGIAYSYRCSGAAYSLVSQYQIGLSDLQKAFVLFFELGNKQAIATTLRNIGNIYKALNQIEKSLEHYYNALRFAKEIDDQPGMAYIYGHIGEAKFILQNYDLALDFMYRAIEIHSERGNDFGLANSYIILGNIYLASDQHQKAFGYILQAINKSNKINYLRGIADANSSLGNFYRDQKNYTKALYQHQIAMSAATEMGEKLLISKIYKNISATYQASGNFEKALETYTRYDEVKSYLQNANNEITVRTLQAQFDLEQSEKEKEIYKFKNIELANANKLIESKNKDITDSIKYAKHIQEAILPERNYMKQYLDDFFIFYKPKDIVSGDFYWFTEKNGLLYLAAVDCTGHGVPGAFVSIVGGNILNQVIRQNDFKDAAEILDAVNTMFNMSIRQTFEDSVVKDGMDIVLCVIDKAKMEVNFAGAYNPLYIARDKDIHIYKGNKFPIGIFIGDEVKKFDSHVISLKKNDVLYLFSDGFVDQFGGNNNKKLMHKRFRELILENAELPMKMQHYNFELFFENWKGNREQVDDILLIGVRI